MIDQEIRKTGIGSSEVGAVLGLSPYTSPLDVWLEKTGQIEPFTGNEHTRLGKRMEGPIIAEYAERTGQALTPLFDQTFVHSERKWQLATPDAKLVAKPKLVEAKNVGIRMADGWGDPGTDQVPEYYLTQGAWQLSTLDLDEVDFAVLIGGNDFRMYTLRRDKDLEAMLLERVEKFWRVNVLDGEMPDIRDTERTREWIKKRHPRNVSLLRPATEKETEIMHQLKKAQDMRKVYEAMEQTAKLNLQYLIGDAEGIAGEGFKLTWRLDGGTKAYSVAAKEPKRVFRPTWSER